MLGHGGQPGHPQPECAAESWLWVHIQTVVHETRLPQLYDAAPCSLGT